MAGLSSFDNILELPMPVVRKFADRAFTRMLDSIPGANDVGGYRRWSDRFSDEELALRNAIDAAGEGRFRDLWRSLGGSGDPLALSQQAVATGRLGGKKLSSNQRRQLAFTNKVVAEGLTTGIPRVGNSYEIQNEDLVDHMLELSAKTAKQIEANYPGLLAPSLVSKTGDQYKYIRRGPKSQVSRMLAAAEKRARKIEGDIPDNQMRLPGARPSRVQAVQKLRRVMNSLSENVPDIRYLTDLDLPYVYRGRSGWMGGYSRVWDNARNARAKSTAVPYWARESYAEVAKNLGSNERQILKNFLNESDFKPWFLTGQDTYARMLEMSVAWSRMSPGAKNAAKNLGFFEYGRKGTVSQLSKDLNALAERYDYLDDNSKEVFNALSNEWYGDMDELFDAVGAV